MCSSDLEDYELDRYCAINFMSINEHNTLELRILEGTLDTKKIINWIKLHLTIIEWVKNNPIINYDKKLNVEEIFGKELYDELSEKKKIYDKETIIGREYKKNFENLGLIISDSEEE